MTDGDACSLAGAEENCQDAKVAAAGFEPATKGL